MAKRQAEERRKWWTWVRPYVLPVLSATLAMLVLLLAFQRVEYFLTHDRRFSLRPGGPGEAGSPDLRITGLGRAPAEQVRTVFREDEGRSVFLTPLAERREELLRIRWVREASVSRVWPNRIDVLVSERTPVAFVRLPGNRRGAPSIPALIDIDGVILPPVKGGHWELPALAGIRADQPVEERAARVRGMRALLADLRGVADKVGEVDGRDLKNWRIITEVDGTAVTLVLGDSEFSKKVRRFLEHWPEIRQRAPGSHVFDLRLADRIVAIEESGKEE
jgi:cell division protein FtsQ